MTLNAGTLSANIPNTDPGIVRERLIASDSSTASAIYRWQDVTGEIAPNRAIINHTRQVTGSLTTTLSSPHYCIAEASSAIDGSSMREYHSKVFLPQDEVFEPAIVLPMDTRSKIFMWRVAPADGETIEANFSGTLRNEAYVSLYPTGSTFDPATGLTYRFLGSGSATVSIAASTSSFSVTNYND